MRKMMMPFIGLLSVTTAFAAVAVFTSVNGSVAGDGDLKVTFRVAGVDPTLSSLDFTVTADATANYACVNRGGNNPNAANKKTTATGNVEGSLRLKAVNGGAGGTVSVDAPEAANFDCPKGQTKTLTKISFTNVKIASDTLGISKSVGRTFQRTLVTPK